jgi:hypothetical protein
MALGYCEAILMHQKFVMNQNAPETKVTASGFLAALLARGVQRTPDGDPFALASQTGHIRDLRLKSYQRTIPAEMKTDDNCEIDARPIYQEDVIDTVSTTKWTIQIDDETIAKYCDEASRTVAVGIAPSVMMQEHLAAIMAQMNGFIGHIDTQLLGAVTWGVNQVTGNNNAVTVNFNDDTDANLFSEGWTKVLADYAQNEGFGTPIVVGSGLVNAAAIQARIPGLTANSSLNNAAAASAIDYFYDLYTGTAWGSNQFGVFQPGTLGLVTLDQFIGFRRAVKQPKGNSYFFNMPINVALPGAETITNDLNIDFQFKYYDCPTTVTIGYEEVTIGRGWALTMIKNYALWQPQNSFKTGDRLDGNNGSLRYTATNA